MPNKRTVHVVDDDEGIRHALGLALGDAGYAFRLHGSALAFGEVSPDAEAGCVVAGIHGFDMTERQFQTWLEPFGAGLPVIVVPGPGDVPMAVSALKAGAFDVVETSSDNLRLLAAVAAALAYRGRTAGRRAGIEKIQGCLNALSTREREVLDGLLAGHANKTIARDLGVSPRTIEVYRSRLMLKMQALSLSALVRMALLAGGTAARGPGRQILKSLREENGEPAADRRAVVALLGPEFQG